MLFDPNLSHDQRLGITDVDQHQSTLTIPNISISVNKLERFQFLLTFRKLGI